MSNEIQAYAVFEAGGKLKPFSYDAGPLAPDNVEISVEHCGICHSDLSMMDNEWGFSEYPLVPGHEVIGTIAAVGEQVADLAVGDKVGLGWHAGYCNTCSQCLSGDHNLCSSAVATIAGHYGGFADKVRAQSTSVIKLPEGLDAKSAGPLFCGGITVFNPLLEFGIKPKDKVAVIGIGGLGHMALEFLNAWGCEVTAFTSTPAKKEEALKMGAHYTLNSRDNKEIQSAAGRFDMIMSTVNVKLDWNLYISTLKPKGRLHFVGATLDPLDVAVFPLIGGQRSISGSPVGSPAAIATMLEFCVRHKIRPRVEMFPFDRINEAIDHLREGKARYRVVLTHE